MRILVTNDDGIDAPGLAILEIIAREIAGPTGEVWTVAPAFEQSGVGHCISFTHPMMIEKLAERRYVTEGSPADCVLAGLHHVMADAPPELVLSGVNRGNNAAENTLYSGTVGGVIEAALHGLPAIALSQFLGPDNEARDNPFEAAAMHGAALVRGILKAERPDPNPYRLFYNVNFPPCPGAGVRGVRVVRQGFRRDCAFSVDARPSPAGKLALWVRGGPQNTPTEEGTDVHANLCGHITVTPMRGDLTARDALNRLSDALSG